MIVTIGNTKGGVGKSTLAVNMAIARSLSGAAVWLVDGDEQGTSTKAMTIRAQSRELGLAFSSYKDGELLRSQVLQQQDKYTDVIIDVGGRDTGPLRAALTVSDVVLVPFQPRSVDVWEAEAIGGLAAEVRRRFNPDLRVVAVVNLADPGSTSDNEAAKAAVAESLAEFEGLDFTLASTEIRRRKSYANAIGQGLSVHEIRPLDKKAIQELNDLLMIVF